MKKSYVLFFLILAILGIRDVSYAATVGNPLDLDVPPKSAVLRQEIIDQTLDEYEGMIEIKTALDVEFLFDKDLGTTNEITNAEMEGQYFMVKLGTTLFNRIEPYVKLGTSDLEVKWRQHDTQNIEIEADDGLAWGGGLKAVLWDSSIRLTIDAQYRSTEPDIEECSINDVAVIDTGGDFKIEEWQASLVLSRKFELPLRWQDIYIVPYTGITVSDSKVDVEITDPDNPTIDYSLFDACNDSVHGFLLGCDIMPALASSFIYSIEVRLVNELALSIGGAMKF